MRTIGEVAELAGMTVGSLRYYDRIGLLKPLARSEAGYRLYGRDELLRLREILVWRQLGFPLADIQLLTNDPERDLRGLVRRQLEMAGDQLEKFHAITRGLEIAAEAIDAGRHPAEDEVFAGFARSLANDDEPGRPGQRGLQPFERVPVYGVLSKRPRYGTVDRLSNALTSSQIVATDPIRGAESLIALGILPIGSGTYEDRFTGERGVWPWPPTVEPLVRRQIADVGYYGGDWEAVRALAPELIIDLDSALGPFSLTKWMHGHDSYEEIAPTVVLHAWESLPPPREDEPSRPGFQHVLRQAAKALGRPSEAELLLALWDARIGVLRPHLSGREVSVVATWGPGEVWGQGFYSPTPLHVSQALFSAGLQVVTPDGAEPFNEMAYTYDEDAARGIASDTVFLHTRNTSRARVHEINYRTLAAVPATQQGRVFELGWDFVNSGWFGANWQLNVIAGAFGLVQLRAECSGASIVAAVDPQSGVTELACSSCPMEAVLCGPGLRPTPLQLDSETATRIDLPEKIVQSLCAFPEAYSLAFGTSGASAGLRYDRESATARLAGTLDHTAGPRAQMDIRQ